MEEGVEPSTLALFPARFCQQGGAVRQVSQTTPPAQPRAGPGRMGSCALGVALALGYLWLPPCRQHLPQCLMPPCLPQSFKTLILGKVGGGASRSPSPYAPTPSSTHWPFCTPSAASSCWEPALEARFRVSFPTTPPPAAQDTVG